MPGALEAGPPPPEGGTATRRSYLGGLPGDYVATPGRRGFPLPPALNDVLAPADLDTRNARGTGGYVDGDQYAYINATPETIARLQRELVAGGLIPAKKPFTLGQFDAVTEEAYTNLLAYSNAAGTSDRQALARLKANPIAPEPEAPKPKRAPLRVDVSNPDTLRAIFQKSARRVQGGKLDDAVVERMVSAFQAAEAAPQRQVYAMGGDEFGEGATGGTVVDSIDPTVFAEEEARAVDPLKADSRKVVAQFGSLVSMLGEGGLLQASGE